MNDDKAQALIREFELLRGSRGTWENHWQEIAERVMPRADTFHNIRQTKGEKKTEKIFDSTAVIALERFASAMESMLTPRNSKWHGLRASSPELNQDHDVKLWFEEVTRLLFAYRYSPKANFASQTHETYMQLGAFGSGSLFVDENTRGGIRYRSIHLGEIYYAEDHQGTVNRAYRSFQMQAQAAQQKPEWEGKLPEKIAKAKNPFEEFEFLHVVMPREDYDPTRADFKGMEFASYYIAVESKTLLSEGGYTTFPYPTGRYTTAPNEIYGRSPAMAALADIKMLNEMSKTDIRAVHKLVDPPILLHNDGLLGGIRPRVTPNAVNYGMVSPDGRPLMQPFYSGARVDIAEEKMDKRRQSINDAFLVTLFQILVENPRMTATEALLRAQEKGALLGPTMGRQQSEFQGPLIERELDILMRQGVIPPMPGALIEAQGEYEIEYDSPLNRLQRAEDAAGIARTLEMLTPLAQIDPSVLLTINPQEASRIVAEVNGVPAMAIRSRDEVQKLLEAQQQAEEQQRQIEQMQPAATAVKDLAESQAMLSGPAQ